MVSHLLSVSKNWRVRLKVFAPDDDLPMVASLSEVWSSANWFEREAFDLYGILFEGHLDLRRVNALVLDWLGPRLAWTEASFLRGTPPFRQADVDYISGYCRTLELPADPDERSVASDFHFGRIDYSVHCGGGAKNSQPSPYSYQFWASELGDQSGPRLNVCSVLSVMVPDTWPHEDFMARITEIAATLRLRWGAAGLTYSRWDYYTYGDWFELYNPNVVALQLGGFTLTDDPQRGAEIVLAHGPGERRVFARPGGEGGLVHRVQRGTRHVQLAGLGAVGREPAAGVMGDLAGRAGDDHAVDRDGVREQAPARERLP